ncbi:hypothetical protein CHO01_17200 [Cellulomonas hominis]|uniref:Uncharacterized protein n=1 Tax=Cellulomonas hominis TaxID=156981 RepID=A0A511FDC6_9CELL|nr:hypothetical protein [Cellulomonas hominis]MBB5474566.1 hypothetical protein [Cellulomonas hominis]NKY05596.1 hypothetical protein [Cellulomonas hominis]GEL46604.1 hypothetical protein CHO01_17200 [Cellulomonas hominis]
MDDTDEKPLSPDEQRAIRSLRALAKRWPRTLTLASKGGELVVLRTRDPRFDSDRTLERHQAITTEVRGIPNTGGDW